MDSVQDTEMRPLKPCCLVLFGVLLVIVTGACTPGGMPMPATFTIARPEDTTPSATQVPPAATALPEDTIPPPTQAPSVHRIGARTVDSVGEFYDRATGERLVALADGGLINQALAPANRPATCQPGAFPFFEHNLALGRTGSYRLPSFREQERSRKWYTKG